MQAVASPGNIRAVALVAALFTSFLFGLGSASAQTAGPRELPTVGLPSLITLPPPSTTDVLPPTSATTPSSSGATGDGAPTDGTAPASHEPVGAILKCRGCAPVDVTSLVRDRSLSDAAVAAAAEEASPQDEAAGVPQSVPFETSITVPGFGLLIALVALHVAMRRRRT
jgi:hypothetical protein